MKKLLSSLLLLAFFTAPNLSSGAEPAPFNDSPVLIYDCNLNGTFQFSQVIEADLGSPIECPQGYGLTKKFKLKSFLIIDGDASVVQINYGECLHLDGRRHKAYWFDSAGSYDYPDFCDLYVEQPNQIDAVSDGIKVTRGVLQQHTALGKKSNRHIIDCYQDVCVMPIDDEYCNYFVSETLDLEGTLSNFTIKTTIPDTKAPFKYLAFCDGPVDPKQSRSSRICAPKNLRGSFTSYFADNNGMTDSYPNPSLIDVEEDLSIEPEYLPTNPVAGYHFACINGNYSCRLNTKFTAMANLYDSVCNEGNAGYGYLNMEGGDSPDPTGGDPCQIEAGDIHYGVLLVALYLESKGYVFDEDDLECAVDRALGLPTDD